MLLNYNQSPRKDFGLYNKINEQDNVPDRRHIK